VTIGGSDGGAGHSGERVGPFWDAMEGRAPMPPVAELLGWQLEEIDPEAGTIVVKYDAKPQFTNPLGNVQGGIVAAMLDDAMGPALVATLPPGQFAPTLEMKISYLAPAKVGPLWAHGRVVKRGRSTAFVEGDLVDEHGKLIARATATVQIITTGPPAS
jgi:uncharacterized protein (TIGR00369 family)